MTMLVLEFIPCIGADCPDCQTETQVSEAQKIAGMSAADVNASMKAWEAQQKVAATAEQVNESLAEWEKEIQGVAQARAETVPKPGNREREATYRALIITEWALNELPGSHAQVAGYLQAYGKRGGVRGDDNVLAAWLKAQVIYNLDREGSYALAEEMGKVNILVEVNGIIIESPKYQVAIDPMPWQEMFMLRLRQGDFKELLSS